MRAKGAFQSEGHSSLLISVGKDGNSPLFGASSEGKTSLLCSQYGVLFHHFVLLSSSDAALDSGFLSPGSEHKKLMNRLNSGNH